MNPGHPQEVLTVTAAEFRRMALSLPETVEASHMNHPDFRVGGRIFATLGYPGAGWGMVSLSHEEQTAYLTMKPLVFMPAKGAWGEAGATLVQLRQATKAAVRGALKSAWSLRAPERLVRPRPSTPVGRRRKGTPPRGRGR